MRRSIAGLSTALLAMTVARPGPRVMLFPAPSSAACSVAGGQALDAGRPGQAQNLFREALDAARKSADREREAQCDYYLGVSAELRASAEHEASPSLLRDAVQAYEAATDLGFLPPSLVIRLARAYSGVGRSNDAAKLYEAVLGQLARQNESRGPDLEGHEERHLIAGLRRDYADLLLTEGRWQKAMAQYRQVLDESPADEPAREALLTVVADKTPEKLADEVWNAVEASQTLTAQRVAFSALAKADVAATGRVSLAAAIAGAMARQYQGPREFERSKLAARWSASLPDPVIGDAARQVLALYREGPAGRDRFSWWARTSEPYARSPLGAFRALLRSIARGFGESFAQSYLKTADDLAPQVPDLEVWSDLLDLYGAADDQEQVGAALRKWEEVLDHSLSRVPDAGLGAYHLHAARVLKTLNWHEAQDVVSVGFQLNKATAAAVRAGDKQLIAAVELERSQVAGERQPGQDVGGGGGGGSHPGFSSGSFDCLSPIGACAPDFVAVPEPLVMGRVVAAGGRRQAIVRLGCGGLRTVAWEPLTGGSATALGPLMAARHEAGATSAETRWATGVALKRMAWPIYDGTRHRRLGAIPYWATSGLWVSENELLVVDSLTRQFLTFGIDGSLHAAAPRREGDQREWPFRLRALGRESMLVETASGELEELDRFSRREVNRRTTLRGRKGREGTLHSVYDWTPGDGREIVALGEVERRDGSWFLGLLRFSLAEPRGFEVLWKASAADPVRSLYSLGNPYLARLGGKVYFLDLHQPMVLREADRARLAPRMGLGEKMRLDLARLPMLESMSAAAIHFRTIEGWTMPSGLYVAGELLYLLVRAPAGDGTTAWQLWRLDPSRHAISARVTIPSPANQLTVIPGERAWAVLEKEAVVAPGVQRARSLLLVPSKAFRGTDRGVERRPTRAAPG